MTRRIWVAIGAAFVAVLVVAAVVVVVVGRGNRTTADNQAAPTKTTGNPASCGLLATPAPAVTGATRARWVADSAGFMLPVSATDGPAKRDPAGRLVVLHRHPLGCGPRCLDDFAAGCGRAATGSKSSNNRRSRALAKTAARGRRPASRGRHCTRIPGVSVQPGTGDHFVLDSIPTALGTRARSASSGSPATGG